MNGYVLASPDGASLRFTDFVRPGASLPLPPTQKALRLTTYAVAGAFFLGEVLNFVVNVRALLNVTKAAFLTGLLVAFWLVVECFVRKYQPQWTSRAGTPIRITGLGVAPRVALLGAVIGLWVVVLTTRSSSVAAPVIVGPPQLQPQVRDGGLTHGDIVGPQERNTPDRPWLSTELRFANIGRNEHGILVHFTIVLKNSGRSPVREAMTFLDVIGLSDLANQTNEVRDTQQRLCEGQITKEEPMPLGGKTVFMGEPSQPIPIGRYVPRRLLYERADGRVDLIVIGCVVYGSTVDRVHHHSRFAYRLSRINHQPLIISFRGIGAHDLELLDLFPDLGSEAD
jgi:hypothetical protein